MRQSLFQRTAKVIQPRKRNLNLNPKRSLKKMKNQNQKPTKDNMFLMDSRLKKKIKSLKLKKKKRKK